MNAPSWSPSNFFSFFTIFCFSFDHCFSVLKQYMDIWAHVICMFITLSSYKPHVNTHMLYVCVLLNIYVAEVGGLGGRARAVSMVLSNGRYSQLFGYEGNCTCVKWLVWPNICGTAASTCYWPLELKKITAGRAVSSSSLSSFVHGTKRHMFLFLPLSLLLSWLRERQRV